MEVSRRNFMSVVLAGVGILPMRPRLGAYDPNWRAPIDTWLVCELHIFIHDRLGSVELRVDGATRHYAINQNTSRPGMENGDHLLIGATVKFNPTEVERIRTGSDIAKKLGYLTPGEPMDNRWEVLAPDLWWKKPIPEMQDWWQAT